MSTKDNQVDLAFAKKRAFVLFNGEEVLCLTDAISNTDVAEGLANKEDYVPLAREILFLLASAYLELIPEAGRPSTELVSLALTEDQLFLLRSKVDSRTKATDQVTPIGVPLLRKLYAALLELHNKDNEPEEWPVADVEDRAITPEDRARLKEFADAADRTSADGSSDQDH